jgi:hypothetical protein
MPRISRIHFASLGHQDARIPALTLDLRDRDGSPADTIIWAENGTGKSSLINLLFSTYRPNQRQFLGKQAEGKARELADYVRDRDLAFVVTEWDITDDQAQGALIGDVSRALLIVGQMLSWRGLERSNELRRLFFTLRPNHAVQLEALPILGLSQPSSSFEAFRDWLDELNRNFPKVEVRYTTNQAEWQDHLANNKLDPELFTYQLRMNESEGGVNNLFNSLKSDRDFIRLFLQLGFDPSSANQVRDNLQQFLPKLRNRSALELQLEFNDKLLQQLSLFVGQLAIWQEINARTVEVERQSAALLSAVRAAAERFAQELTRLSADSEQLETDETRLTSQRAAITRKQNYFRTLRCRLEEEEARAAFQLCETECDSAEKHRRVVEMAVALAELTRVETEAEQLRIALGREREEAKPALAIVKDIGGRLKSKLNQEIAAAMSSITATRQEYSQLRGQIHSCRETEKALTAERAEKRARVSVLETFFTQRESERERLRREGWVEVKETATVAAQRWNELRSSALAAHADAKKAREIALGEKDEVLSASASIAQEMVAIENEKTHLAELVLKGETEEERIATHEQMRAAVESTQADLNLPQTGERLAQLAESLFRRILRINVESAEEQRAKAYFDKHGLFPPHRDVEVTVEKLTSAGMSSATTAMNWLAYNVADSGKAAALLADDPSTFSGVMFDNQLEAERSNEVLRGLCTEQIPVCVSLIPTSSQEELSSPPGGPIQSGVSSLLVTLLPRHAGTFNFEAARTEVQRLEAQQRARTHELETLKGTHAATRTLLDDLQAWTLKYGGAKLRMLRERLRTSGQALDDLRERQFNALKRKEALEIAIRNAEANLTTASELKDRSVAAIGQLGTFLKQFEAPYESNGAERLELGNRLQEIEVELLSTFELRVAEESKEAILRDKEIALQVHRGKLEDEARQIRYADLSAGDVQETLDRLRNAYEYQAKQYEGTFLNSKAQGELSAVEKRITEIEQRVAREFKGVDRLAAELISRQRDVDGQLQSANSSLKSAHEHRGRAEQKLIAARDRLRELGGMADQDRPTQVEIIPQTSADAAEELAKLDRQAEEFKEKAEQNRRELDRVAVARNEVERRSSTYTNHLQRLSDLSLPDAVSDIELPTEDARTADLVNERISGLHNFRKERDKEHGKLQERYSTIQDLTQEDRYAKATDLPARSLFAHMPIEELRGCVGQKLNALDEEIKTIRADLDLMAQHRETLVTSLLNVSKQAIRLLRRAEKWSTMPGELSGWENEPFLKIRLLEPQGELECRSRLKWLVDSILADGRIPAGVELVFQAIMALVGETGIDATILKPETQRRKIRYAVKDIFSVMRNA